MNHTSLDWIALGLLVGIAIFLVYLLIYIHDIPYQIARERKHPQQDAIFVGCWLSLLMLHVMWPLLFMWAVSHRGTQTTADADAEKEVFVGVFPQNVLRSIAHGAEAEIAFRSAPGYVFRGTVDRAAAVIAEGQILAGGELQSFTKPQPPGRVPIAINIDPQALAALNLPGGAAGAVTIYTGQAKPTELLRRVLLRMQSWENYLLLE